MRIFRRIKGLFKHECLFDKNETVAWLTQQSWIKIMYSEGEIIDLPVLPEPVCVYCGKISPICKKE